MAVTDIIILTESPFSRRDYDRFGVELLSKRFQVSILDCTRWLKPEFWDKYQETVYRCPGYVSVTDLGSLIGHIHNPVKAIAIDYLGSCAGSKRIRKELKDRNISRAIVLHGTIPTPAIRWPSKVGLFISSNTPLSMLKKIYRRNKQILNPDPAPEIALLAGTAGLKDKRLNCLVHKIWAHSFDFDIYLENKGQASSSVAPYAVFLDEDMVHHSDYTHMEIKVPATEEAYYTSMNSFFQKFENEFGMSVKVAAHPRSHYDLRPQLWNGRTTISGKTAQLVRNATIVLCHQSTAVNFAVMWRRPLLYLTTNELMSSYLQPRIALGSALLRAHLINIDGHNELPTIEALLAVDEGAYAKYTDEYIKRTATPNYPAWHIFSEYIQNSL
jgi:hypothetical protein